MDDQNQNLIEAIARNAALVLSLPSAGMLRHYKSRFLAESGQGFAIEGAQGESALIDDLIVSQQLVGISFKHGQTKVVFTTRILGKLPQYQINSQTTVEALLLKHPDGVKTIQRRANYRVRATGELAMKLRIWRIGEKTHLRDRPMASQELAVELRDLSIGGVGVLIKGKDGTPPRVTEADRLRIQLNYQDHDLLMEGRLREPQSTPQQDAIRSGIRFKLMQDDLAGRQTTAEFIDRHQPADARQGVNVRAGLVGGRTQKPDQRHRPAVDGLKIDRGGGLADGHDQVGSAGGFAVGNGQTVADAGGPRRLAVENGVQHFFGIQQLPVGRQQVDQLRNRLGLLGCLQRDFDVLRLENFNQAHVEQLRAVS
jgi:c-di-GMP-binding flagellar brake protein YcgR